MAAKGGAAKPKVKNVQQSTVAFKRHMSFVPSDADNVIEITPAYPPIKPKITKYKKFGYADDGGRYELLMSAITRGRLNMTKTLIGILPPFAARDAVSPQGENSLMLALHAIDDPKRRRRMMELLLSHGASVKYINPNTGESLVHYCCGKVRDRFVDLKWFLGRWPVELDINRADFKGNNALHLAVRNDDVPMVVYLLRLAYKSFSNLDVPNMERLTPYLLAHKLGHTEIADLIDKTAKVGVSALEKYVESKSETVNSGRRSVRDDSDIVFPVLVNNSLPARFDGFQVPIRNRTAIRKEGVEERLTQSLDTCIKKRVELLVHGQPEHLPRIPIPSAIIRREQEEKDMQKRSLHNLSEALALLPHYAVAHEQKHTPLVITRIPRSRKGTNQSKIVTSVKAT